MKIEAQPPECCCNPAYGGGSEQVIGQGVEVLTADRSGFSYRTYEETTIRRRHTDLPVVFNALLVRER
ncbi:hypothetical protein [Bacillus xiapuensis]|uniref:hypothetical protein n=1 Tax=Bacillus xiapuensis TaxID=2014075 RepID=UPI001E6510E4|nr:hypothetical protein [Bacillus xiapuensis]